MTNPNSNGNRNTYPPDYPENLRKQTADEFFEGFGEHKGCNPDTQANDDSGQGIAGDAIVQSPLQEESGASSLESAVEDSKQHELGPSTDQQIIEAVAFTLYKELYHPWLSVIVSKEKENLKPSAIDQLKLEYRGSLKGANYGQDSPYCPETEQYYVNSKLEEKLAEIVREKVTPEMMEEFIKKRIDTNYAAAAISQIMLKRTVMRGENPHKIEDASMRIIRDFFDPFYNHVINEATTLGVSNQELINRSERVKEFLMKAYRIATARRSDHYKNGIEEYKRLLARTEQMPGSPVFGQELSGDDINRLLDYSHELPIIKKDLYLGVQAPEKNNR